MKFNWGTGIAIFIWMFIIFILSFVFTAAYTHTDLYAEDYYQQELDYQNTIDAKQNAKSFDDEVYLSQGTQSIVVHLPENIDWKNTEGSVHLYRANDASQDKTYKITTENSKMIIPKNDLTNGKFYVKIAWQNEEKNYLITKEIVLE
jgi:hypothetical protein